MNILSEIIAFKRQEVESAKKSAPLDQTLHSANMDREAIPLAERINDTKPSIIAEFKRKSPSKGIINDTSGPAEVVQLYQEAGAAAVSVLTDSRYFGGSDEDLIEARKHLTIPVLRKDFIVDEYQIYQAKSIGADVILLIAAALKPDETYRLAQTARNLGLEVLLELHDRDELDHVNEYVSIAGINNRNLKTFEVNLEQSVRLAEKLPSGLPKISESGISGVEQIGYLWSKGFRGFLVGENFMKTTDPGRACKMFIQDINRMILKTQ